MDVIFPMQWGAHDGQCVKVPMDKSNVTFMILLSFKTQLGFAGRDYMYYKKRHDRDVAYLKDVEMMLEANEQEKEVRLVLSKEAEVHEMLTITPQK
jgi:predicted metalloendopeptidase